MGNHTAVMVQLVTREMRIMLYIASGLVFALGTSLFLLTEQTDRYFAWTIQAELTAAFLGGAYWSAGILEFTAARRRHWADAQVAVPAVITFSALTLVVTLLHFDRFHFGASEFITRAGTWFWLAVYVSVPVIMTVLLVRQLREPGEDPPSTLAMPTWMALLMLAIAVVLLLLGLALLVIPSAIVPLWPWPLTALTGRAVGAWLVGLGVAAGHSTLMHDLIRSRPVMISAIVFCILQFIALARYPAQFAWGTASAWAYLIFLALFFAIGIYGWTAPRTLVTVHRSHV